MRSEITKRILEETPKEVKDFMHDYGKKRIALWELKKDSPAFKRKILISFTAPSAFLFILMLTAIILLRIDYQKVNTLTALYKQDAFIYALNHRLEVGIACIAFSFFGCWWLAKRVV